LGQNGRMPTAAENRAALPLLARHEGVWEGIYRHFDAAGQKIDEHASHLVCTFPEGGDPAYHQANRYRWPDGRTELREFPATIEGGRLRWDNELIVGWAAEDPLDEHRRTVLLHWRRKDLPDAYLYEMIQISDCGRFRSRVWHWYQDGRLFQRTLIDEVRVAANG
jgi:hypothetical protein